VYKRLLFHSLAVKKTYLLFIVVAIASYFIGKVVATFEFSEESFAEHYYRVSQQPEFQSQFFSELKSSTLKPVELLSGNYQLKVFIENKSPQITEFYIPFKNNQPNFSVNTEPTRTNITGSLKIENNCISWYNEGIMYDAGVRFVGVVSGNQMFGTVYNYEQTKEGEVGYWQLSPIHAQLTRR